MRINRRRLCAGRISVPLREEQQEHRWLTGRGRSTNGEGGSGSDQRVARPKPLTAGSWARLSISDGARRKYPWEIISKTAYRELSLFLFLNNLWREAE